MAETKIKIKVKDEVSPVLKKLNRNLVQIDKLLLENKKLLSKVLKIGFEVINT